MESRASMKGTIWCLHGAVGMADDWRGFSVPGWAVKRVDLWRFLDCCPMELPDFGRAMNEEADRARSAERGARNVLLGYSMGGRLALHALLADYGGQAARGRGRHLWDAAVIVSAHPGLEDEGEKKARRARDAEWAAKALKGDWREFLAKWNGQAVLGNFRSRISDFGLKFADRTRLEMRRQAVARSFMDWSLGRQEALGDRLDEIGCPLLWVAGGEDGKFRELARQAADRSIRPPSFWIAPGAGHRVPWESPEFPERVGEFLERAVS